MKFLVVITFLISVVSCERARYDNYRVYEIFIKDKIHLDLMHEIEKNPDGYRLMEHPSAVASKARLIVPPHKFGEFSELREKFHLNAEMIIENLQKVLDNEQPRRRPRSTLDWTRYWTLNEINSWLELLTISYPNDVKLVNIGDSYEGRQILGVRVNIGGGLNKKSLIFEGTHHAREWISPATVNWFLNELLTSNDPEVKEIANNYEMYFFPVTNPDGYEYTWTTNRLWRKTRSPTTNLLCTGTDLNRNWDNYFNQGGTSFNPCSDIYAGEKPFSEPESRQLADFIKSVENLAGYFAFHSYSQLLMIPYGFTHELLDNYEQLYEIGLKAIETLKSKYGTEYEVGSIANIIYIATGASIDWVKYELKTNVTYEWELRDTGYYGFNLPADQIIPNCIEVFASFVTIIKEAQLMGIA